MIIKNMLYFIREALNSLMRNRLLSFATISTVSISILILGIAVLMTMNAGSFMNRLESDVEIIAFLEKNLSSSQIRDAGEEIEKMDGVKQLTFVSKKEALHRLQENFGGKEYNLGTTIGENPLPNSYEIKAADPHNVADIAKKVEKVHGVYKVNYGQGVVEKLFNITKWIRVISVIFIVLVSLGAVLLIATTIRLAIFARRKEIKLMQLIGATDWFIRWPFFIEGILLGSLGALVAIVLLLLGYDSLISKTDSIYFFSLLSDPIILSKIYISLFLTGSVLGVLGTYISLNRFLDV